MSNSKDAIDKLIDGILLAVDKIINNAKYDKTFRCGITEIISENKYKVKINGIYYTVRGKNGYLVGDLVYVIVPQNNYKDIFIVF